MDSTVRLTNVTLTIDGEVNQVCSLSIEEIAAIDSSYQVSDISKIFQNKKGQAIRLRGLLDKAGVKSAGNYLTLHATRDDFHASIPLGPVEDKGYLIFAIDGQPLSVEAGGPFRFMIENFAACHTEEIDECANVKFVDRIEITSGKGFDNRPSDEDEHAALHEHENEEQ